VKLQGTLHGENATYSWQPLVHMENANSLTPNVKPLNNITYSLSALSIYGCSSSDDVSIKVINGIYIPTSFTPNGDGVNDAWRIPYIEYASDAEVKIYNRYGNLVYRSKGGAAIWDGTLEGKPQPSGVYIYLVSLKKGVAPLRGFLTLLR
jgi:gliding motility-associated-like protein